MMVLFVCHANLNRSPRAAEVFQKLVGQKGLSVEVSSAGTNAFFSWLNDKPELLHKGHGVDHVTQLTDEILEKADIVVALDNWVREEIQINFKIIPKRLITLKVPDRYTKSRNNLDELYELLNEELGPLVKELSLLEGKSPNKEIL